MKFWTSRSENLHAVPRPPAGMSSWQGERRQPAATLALPRSGTGRAERGCALAFLAAFLAFASPAHAEQKIITGTVAYDGRVPLPSDALLEVRLVDKSVPGVAPQPVARNTQPATGDPIAFKLSFDETAILAGHRYALDARIGSATAIWFASGDESTLDPLSVHYPVRLSVGMIARPPVEEEQKSAPSKQDDDDSGSDDNFDN
ncbi:MAG: YbaY family lipoprotein [Rhizobiales bacterium]|nr:YbaY family lipoprotein [Hyphomicrobiales bacterium]